MARKEERLVGLLAFLGLIISTACYIFSAIDSRFSILYSVGYICLLIVVLYTAWEFVKRQSMMWRLVFYVIAIITILGFAIGNFDIF